jgi:hypothetical protein
MTAPVTRPHPTVQHVRVQTQDEHLELSYGYLRVLLAAFTGPELPLLGCGTCGHVSSFSGKAVTRCCVQ